MGTIIESKCNCGHEKRFAVGGGRMDYYTNCGFPCYCYDCKKMFSANLFDKKSTCTNCGSKNFKPYDHKALKLMGSLWKRWFWYLTNVIKGAFYKPKNIFDWNTKEKLGRQIVLTDEEYFCPKCKRFTMKFEFVGSWD